MPWPPIRLTASRITVAPWPVFQSLTAGPSTDATASSSTKRTSGSCGQRVESARAARLRRLGRARPGTPARPSRPARGPATAPGPARRPARRSARPSSRSSGSSSSNTRAAANPSDAAASPVAQTSTSRCSASSSCCSPSSKRRDPGLGGIAAAEPAAMVADDRLDGRQHLRRRHQPHGDPRPAEHGVDDLAVRAVGDEHAVLDRVAADDAAGRHAEAEHRVAGGGQLVDELAGPHAADRRCRRRDFSSSTNAVPLMRSSAEATAAATKSAWPMPVMNRPRLSICRTGSLPGFHSAMRILPSRTPVSTPTCGSGSVSTNAPCHGSRSLPGLARRHQPHVARALVVGAALVNRRQREHVAEHGRGRAGIDPRQFEGGEGDAEVLRAVDAPAVLAVDREDREAGGVERLHQAGLVGRPRVRVPRAAGHQPRHGPARDAARGLHDAAEVLAIRKPPLNRADIIVGQASKHRQRPSVRKPGTPWVQGEV